MDSFMDAAIAEAQAGLAEGGIPIGSVLVHQGKIIGRGHNRRVQKGSAILHGEMDALENGGRLPAAVYAQSVLYTTLSPCAMCSGAILLYRIPRVVVGENVTFLGEEELLRSRRVVVDVLQDSRCIEMMREFIRKHPTLWNEDIGVDPGASERNEWTSPERERGVDPGAATRRWRFGLALHRTSALALRACSASGLW